MFILFYGFAKMALLLTNRMMFSLRICGNISLHPGQWVT